MIGEILFLLVGVFAGFLMGFALCAAMNNAAMTGRQNFIHAVFGYCPQCGRWFCRGVKRRRQNTAYEDEESNYITVCRKCYDEVQALWAEKWEEYWSSCL